MSETKRFFTNQLHDYDGSALEIAVSEWKTKLLPIVSLIRERTPYEDFGGGLYTGVGGVAYMYQYLAQLPLFREERGAFMKEALKYINASLKYLETLNPSQSKEPAFLLGNAGIYAVAAVIHRGLGNRKDSEKNVQNFINAGTILTPCENYDADEFLVGRAGYLSGALWLENVFGEEVVPREQIIEVCKAMIQSGRNYALNNSSPCPLMYAYHGQEYIGAAHGLSSILQVILSIPESLDSDPDVENDVRTSVDYLMSLQVPSGNFPSAMGSGRRSSRSDPDDLVQWCHGAPGVVYLMAKAFIYWRDEKYLESCIQCGEITWERGLLWKGPGICHGVAGNAYTFLLLYRLNKNLKYLHRAQEFANFIFTPEFRDNSRTPDNPYSLYEGLAGTACFIADLTQVNSACFPFMHIF